ncbi:MAG: hypothetical protein ACLPID_13320 [Beijerinckiaceae bacterium]
MMILLRIAFISALTFAGSVAVAHDFWDNGDPVDPVTKFKCCGENDCLSLAEDLVTRVEGGFLFRDTQEIITDDHVQPSPDGHFWRCVWGGQTRCFFAPFTY